MYVCMLATTLLQGKEGEEREKLMYLILALDMLYSVLFFGGALRIFERGNSSTVFYSPYKFMHPIVFCGGGLLYLSFYLYHH